MTKSDWWRWSVLLGAGLLWSLLGLDLRGSFRPVGWGVLAALAVIALVFGPGRDPRVEGAARPPRRGKGGA